ncbi:MAG: hypothetical protein LBH69_00405 [Methanomassiliicoccaceae archaeon]|jgi:hypothetical protein|nr:hypothetical protein [Methanomassiliicoccaceae archaeon]
MHEMLELLLCHVQGDLFELSAERGFASIEFIDAFMGSKCAAALDMDFNKLQWMDAEYIMDALVDELGDKLVHGEQESMGALSWAGHLYRNWHFITGESSKEISKQAPADQILRGYLYYDQIGDEATIEELKEKAIKRSAKRKRTMIEKGEFDLAPSAAKRLR